MRYDRQIYFVADGKPAYNAATGDYDSPEPTKTPRMASIMDTKEQTMQLVYGGLKQGSLTIHLQNHYNAPFDRIVFGGRRYRVDASRKLRVKHVFIVSEVP